MWRLETPTPMQLKIYIWLNYTFPSVSAGDWFQENTLPLPADTTNLQVAQVPYIK